MRKLFLTLVLAMPAAGTQQLAAQTKPLAITMTKMPPDSTLQVTSKGSNIGVATSSGKADGLGLMTMVIDLGSLAKAINVQAYTSDQCADGKLQMEISLIGGAAMHAASEICKGVAIVNDLGRNAALRKLVH